MRSTPQSQITERTCHHVDRLRRQQPPLQVPDGRREWVSAETLTTREIIGGHPGSLRRWRTNDAGDRASRGAAFPARARNPASGPAQAYASGTRHSRSAFQRMPLQRNRGQPRRQFRDTAQLHFKSLRKASRSLAHGSGQEKTRKETHEDNKELSSFGKVLRRFDI